MSSYPSLAINRLRSHSETPLKTYNTGIPGKRMVFYLSREQVKNNPKLQPIVECSLAEILRWSVALPGTKIGEKEISMCFHTWIETLSRVSVRRGKHYESRKWVMSNKTCYYFLPSPLEEDLKMRKVAFFSKYVPLYDIWNIFFSYLFFMSCLGTYTI